MYIKYLAYNDISLLNLNLNLKTNSDTLNSSDSQKNNIFLEKINFSKKTSINAENLQEEKIKQLFVSTKNYFKYLTVIKTKIINSNVISDNEKIFLEYYDCSINLFEEINKEYFWIINGDTFKSFRLHNNLDEINTHKKNFIDNFIILDSIVNYYGFDTWIENKNKKKSSNEILININ